MASTPNSSPMALFFNKKLDREEATDETMAGTHCASACRACAERRGSRVGGRMVGLAVRGLAA